MSNKNGKPKLITDPQEIAEILNGGKPSHKRELWNRVDDQTKQAISQIMQQATQLLNDILGFEPSRRQLKKYGKVEITTTGSQVYYWQGTPILKLFPVQGKRIRTPATPDKIAIKLFRRYEILAPDTFNPDTGG